LFYPQAPSLLGAYSRTWPLCTPIDRPPTLPSSESTRSFILCYRHLCPLLYISLNLFYTFSAKFVTNELPQKLTDAKKKFSRRPCLPPTRLFYRFHATNRTFKVELFLQIVMTLRIGIFIMQGDPHRPTQLDPTD